MKPVNGDLLQRLHGGDIYAGFPLQDYRLDLNNWQSQHPFFAEAIAKFRPRLIVELGSWKGGSAVHMAGLVKQLSLDCPIICIDTWLGHWFWWAEKQTGSFSSERTLWQEVNTRHGWPQVFYQFLANVIHSGAQDIIVPVPQTTTHGLAMLRHLAIQPDMIYIDADHDYAPVYQDIKDAYALLPPGGVLLGDDYYAEYPGVMQAVDQFAAEQKLTFATFPPNKWLMQKPSPV